MLIQNKKIAIVGGGPGGLTLARLLQLQGAHVKVYERDLNKDARVQGATLDLHEGSGLEAIRKAGLMDAFEAHYRPGADKVRILDQKANIIADQHLNEQHDEARPEIDRGPLRKILLESLLPDTVVWDSQFKTLSQIGNTWKLEFQNGNTAVADLVIAADGANSKIRPLITEIKPFYVGITIVEGVVYDTASKAPKLHKLLKGGKIFAFGNDQSLIVSSKGDGSLAFYNGCKTDEYWSLNCGIDFNSKQQVLAWFQQDFKNWDSIWYELFENAEPHFTPRPQYCMPLDQSWETLPNLTMLGDAAHLMPPYAGEGVNMAMLDALELSMALQNPTYPNLHTAIAHYEKHMCARAAEAAKMTLESTEILHSPEAISFMSTVVN